MSWSSDNFSRGRILHAGDVTVRAADLGTVAARPARGIVVSAELVESAKQDGYAAGHDEGYAEGYQQGIAAAEGHANLLGQLVQRLAAAADELSAREATARADIEDQVVAVALQIAEVVIGHELSQPDTRGRDAIARALALAPERGHVTARLHPADIAVIDPAAMSTGRTIDIVPDPTLAPGDCIVDVGACRVDARIGPALERAREVLEQS
jgi:flagellar assembly protein FliH